MRIVINNKGPVTHSIYRYKVVIFFHDSFVCPIITHNPWTNLPQILIGELERTTGMFLA